MPHSEGVAGLAHTYLNEGWALRDERYRGLPALYRRGVTSDLDFATPEELARNPFYQDYLVPHGCPWFAGLRISADNEVRCLTLQRSAGQGPFSEADKAVLASLARSLSTSAALASALSFARAHAALASFDASGTAIVLLDQRGQVLRVNRAADRVIGADVKIVNRKLMSWSHSATEDFDKALKGLFFDPNPRASAPPVRFPRSSADQRPYLLYALRLPPVTGEMFSACRGVVVIADLEGQAVAQDVALKAAFDLTGMERAVARQVAGGKSLETAAALLNITKDTARAHLQSVFAKTGTHRQSELAVLLSRLFRLPE